MHYAAYPHIRSSFRSMPVLCTRILKPFDDSEPTGLKVDIAVSKRLHTDSFLTFLDISSFWSVLFFASFFCSRLFSCPQRRQFLSRALVHYCFLVFCCTGEYISLDLVYPTHCDDLFLVVCSFIIVFMCFL